MYGLSIAILTCIGTSLTSWYLAYDTVTCSVRKAGTTSTNGYYSAVGGIYFKRGEDINYFPDVFQTFSLRKDIGSSATIALTKHSWAIYTDIRKQISYVNTPEHPEKYLSNPPISGWMTESGKLPEPSVFCQGSLQDSPALPSASSSNIAQMIQRPVTTLLLGIIFYYAYVLWSNRTEVSQVSYSYDAIVDKGEYWRMVTSSFSHFDAWHLLFNTMSLFQLGELEVTYGSGTFLFLNIDLVFITMGICVLTSHILIYKFNRTEEAYQQAVGFSCVLFAWMVAASVRMKQYCPIFLLPTLCFTTYYIPNPLAIWNLGPISGFPVNVGPLLLLVVTKVIIPRSSFFGHLSGIIIGYPLAWNGLNWLTPPILFSIIIVIMIYKSNLLPFKFPGYEMVCDLNDVAPPVHVQRYLRLRTIMWVLIFLSWVAGLMLGVVQVLPRVVLSCVVWGAVQCRRCEWLTTLRNIQDDCLHLMYIAAVAVAGAVIYDLASLSTAFAAYNLLIGCGLSVEYIYSGAVLLIALITIEIYYFCVLIGCLNDIKLAEPTLTLWRLNVVSLNKDFKLFGLSCLSCCGAGNAESGLLFRGHVFDGPGRRLAVSTPVPDNEETKLWNGSKAATTNANSANTLMIDINKINGKKITKIDVPAPLPFPVIPNTSHALV